MSADSPAVIDAFRAEHQQIEDHLTACEPLAAQAPALIARLKQLEPLLLGHLDAKELFYARLKKLCADNSDLASANFATMFSENMDVQSAAIRRFFTTLEVSPQLQQSFSTIALIVRSRLRTEDRAVFPLYLKNLRKRHSF